MLIDDTIVNKYCNESDDTHLLNGNPINEVYFGNKNKYTIEMEKLISDLIKLKVKDDMKDKELSTVISPTLDKLEEVIEEFVKTKVCVMVEVSDKKTYNCSTFVAQLKKSTPVKLTKYGLIFGDSLAKAKLYIIFSWCFVFKPILTPEEITACLLHELGHDFSSSVIPLTSGLNTLKLALSISNRTKLGLYKNKKIDKTGIDKFKSYFEQTYRNIPNILEFLKGFIGDITDTAKLLLAKMIPLMNSNGYADEKFADSFATMHGYGPYLASALKKLDDYDAKRYKDSPLMDAIMGCASLALLVLFDEHPSTIVRMKTQVSLLEFELANDKTISPLLREEIQSQIIEIKALMKQYLIISESDKYSMAKKEYGRTMLEIFDDGDIFGGLVKSIFSIEAIDKKIKTM